MTQTNGVSICKRPRETGYISFLIVLSAFVFVTTVSEALAASVSPTTLSYSASSTSPMPSSKTVTFSKNSIVSKNWTASGNAAWMTVSPSTGTIAREKDQITVNINASGLIQSVYGNAARSLWPADPIGMSTSYTAGNLTGGGKTYYFAVTAVNTAGTESQHSNEVNKTIQ